MAIQFNLQKKMLIAFLGVGLLPMGIMGIIATTSAKQALETSHQDQMFMLESNRRHAVESYFETVMSQMKAWAEDPDVQKASIGFSKAFANYQTEDRIHSEAMQEKRTELAQYYNQEFNTRYKDQTGKGAPVGKYLSMVSDAGAALQHAYVVKNPNPVGSKDQMDEVAGGAAYHRLHAEYHPFFHEFQQRFGLYDIFLIDPNSGDIVYTVFKELDFASNLERGPWATSELAAAYKATKSEGFPGYIHLADYKPYTPSYEAPASFIAAPIYVAGNLTGILAFQLPLDRITKIMSVRDGLGRTGESFLVGSDFLPRSDTYLDTANRTVLKSYRDPENGRIETEPVKLALAGKKGVGLFTSYAGYEVLTAYSPLKVGNSTWAAISEISTEEAYQEVETLIWTASLVALVGGGLIILIAILFTRSITGPVSRIIQGLRQSSNEVLMASGQIAQTSQQMASGATEQAGEVQTVSSTMEEMSAMTKNNAANAQQVDQMIKTTRQDSEAGLKSMHNMAVTIGKIKESSDETAKIIKNINAIAFQTNILALNATVEAARAGEAGMGFAVVADEVRNLAQNAAEAARDTERLLEEAQRNVLKGVEATEEVTVVLEGIKGNIEKVSALISEVSSASTEQAGGIENVSRSISQIDKVTQTSSANAENTAAASEELSAQTKIMDRMVSELSEIIEKPGQNGSQRQTSAISHGVQASWSEPGMPAAKSAPKADWSAAPAPQAAMSGKDLIPFDESELKQF